MKKKAISLLLIVAMICSMIPFTAFADEGENDVEQAVLDSTQTQVTEVSVEEGKQTEISEPTADSQTEINSVETEENAAENMSAEESSGESGEEESDTDDEIDPYSDAGADKLNGIEADSEINPETTPGEGNVSEISVDLVTSMPALLNDTEGTGDTVRRDIILMLDVSDSMRGNPFTAMKEAAAKFCEQLLAAEGDNRIALVVWDYSCQSYAFSGDIEAVKQTIANISLGSGTNTEKAISEAKKLMDSSSRENAIRNIILLTDGIPQHGTMTADGPYTSSDSTYYKYANTAYHAALELTAKYSFYTLGFFHNLTGSRLAFGQRFLQDIQNAGYYEVTDPDYLEFVFGEVANDINKKTHELTFSYQSGSDYTATCYFNQNYFSESSYYYNPSLATMSLSLAMAAFGSGNEEDYAKKSVNAQTLLCDIADAIHSEVTIGTNDWFTEKPTTDSIGVIVGSMPIRVNGNKETLIAIAVRGGGYEREWASNFTIGTSGQHAGFNTAKDNVLKYVKEFIAENNISGDVKIWITGYSRAAATANLVGGAIDNGEVLGSDISYSLDDVYTYCFETPAGALTSQVKGKGTYSNIFNIINASDPVPYVAPAALGFARYGIDRYLPSAASNSNNYTSLQQEMLKIYHSLASTDAYCVDDFQMKKIALRNWLPGGEKISFIQDDTKNHFSQGLYLSNYVTILAKEFMISRSNYVTNYQDEIREICSVVFGCTDEQSEELLESFTAQAKENWKELVGSYVWNVGANPWGTEADALKVISGWLLTAVKAAGIEDYNEAIINRAGIKLGDLLLALISNHPNYASTLVENISSIGAAHYPELCYAWLASMDPNYSGGTAMNNADSSFNNGSYRIIRINCEVDVQVYNSKGALVASIVSDTPQNVSGSAIISAINEDGEKIVVLPVDETYRITITGREKDSVNFGIDEYCAMKGDLSRSVDFFNVELGAGEKLTGMIPAYSAGEIANDTPDGSTAKYTLIGPDNQEIKVSSDLSGTKSTDAYYMVSVTPSNRKYGAVAGSGLRQFGNFAQIEALPFEGYEFYGWYIGGKLISLEPVYRFCVTEEIELVARFGSIESIETVPMYRLSNPNSGEHFYTGSIEERDNLVSVGWNYEGVAWNAPVYIGDPVYRVFNPNSGDHHYTMSKEEVDNLVAVGWRYEGVAWNSASSDNVPQYRLYNPNADLGSHHYTSSPDERKHLVDEGWNYEGIGWFGMVK